MTARARACVLEILGWERKQVINIKWAMSKSCGTAMHRRAFCVPGGRVSQRVTGRHQVPGLGIVASRVPVISECVACHRPLLPPPCLLAAGLLPGGHPILVAPEMESESYAALLRDGTSELSRVLSDLQTSRVPHWLQ